MPVSMRPISSMKLMRPVDTCSPPKYIASGAAHVRHRCNRSVVTGLYRRCAAMMPARAAYAQLRLAGGPGRHLALAAAL
jgi:hypothetical protein